MHVPHRFSGIGILAPLLSRHPLTTPRDRSSPTPQLSRHATPALAPAVPASCYAPGIHALRPGMDGVGLTGGRPRVRAVAHATSNPNGLVPDTGSASRDCRPTGAVAPATVNARDPRCRSAADEDHATAGHVPARCAFHDREGFSTPCGRQTLSDHGKPLRNSASAMIVKGS